MSEVARAIKLYLKQHDLDVFDFFKEFDPDDQDYIEKPAFIRMLQKVGQFSPETMEATF